MFPLFTFDNDYPPEEIPGMRKIIFQACEVVIWNESYMETVFPDGNIAPALFSFADSDKRLAAVLGYGDNVLQMHREHDVAHTFLAEAEGQLYSPVLRGIAISQFVPLVPREREEERVLMFQRYLNTGQTSKALDGLSSLEQLARQFRMKIKEAWPDD